MPTSDPIRGSPLDGTVPTGCFAKHSQWCVLNRRASSVALSQPPSYMNLWRETLVPDEHFLLTTIRYAASRREGGADPSDVPNDIACHPSRGGDFDFPMHVCWSKAARPPAPHTCSCCPSRN